MLFKRLQKPLPAPTAAAPPLSSPSATALGRNELDSSTDSAEGHGRTNSDRIAVCALGSGGLIDCAACLINEVERLVQGLEQVEEGMLGREIVRRVLDAGWVGLSTV